MLDEPKRPVDCRRPPVRLIPLAATISICALLVGANAAELKTENVFLITTDGLRWQEVFTGAEEALLAKEHGGVKDVEGLKRQFWRATSEERRQALLPFLWSEVAAKGQIFGNQTKGSFSQIVNDKRFSYPGYSEFLTGVVDPRIDSNNKIPNPNTNVFEWLNLQPGFQGKVATVVNWDVIPWILNAGRSPLPVWSGYALPANASRSLTVSPELEQLVENTTPIWSGVIMDSITFQAALTYVKQAQPRVFYVAFAETDEWAHDGRYDCYLRAAHNVDRFIQTLWQTVQSLPAYRDTTSFIISTDHGRGSGPQDWRHHSAKIAGAENTWIAVIGPDTPPLGERTNCVRVTQSQIAATVAALVGQDYHAAFPPVAGPIKEVIKPAGY
ncbi:MAG: alkaline phosphatase family protein [Verrucomicrobia bacterium]|nr:alkaline phosphatase family protein [Verrucomicrobiota bacterium]